MRRLAIVLSHPVQYYSPWFRWLRANTPLEFRVFYLWNFGVTPQRDPQFERVVQWDIDLLSGYEYEFVPNIARDPGTHHFLGLNNPVLTDRLAAWGPEAVLLFGYNWLTHVRVVLWARRRGVPLLLRGDSHRLGRPRPDALRRAALGLLFRQFQAFCYVGQANLEYYRTFGVPEHRLFLSPHAVDGTRFDASLPGLREAADQQRLELGLKGRRVVLFAGKLHAGKQPLELLRAFQEVAGPDDALVYVGDGPLREQLVSEVAARPDRLVRFLPFANQSLMPARYLLADIFALPSRGHYETWGLAVNEAMHLGVPCLVTNLVGCQADLVTPGETGWVCPAGDRSALAGTLRTALQAPPEECRRLGRNAVQRVSRYSYSQASRGLLAALDSLSGIPVS
jgi:glycosyltransferase involved in cell wall biosynthesis